jgi:hypothetical protein
LGRSFRAWKNLTALELGLPQAEVTVATGHQAELWHPGILSKFVWAQEQSLRAGAAFVHLLVDTDTRDPLAFRAPLAEPGALTMLHVGAHSFAKAHAADIAACAYPAGSPVPFEPHIGGRLAQFALPCVQEGIANTVAALQRWSTETDGATQAWHALSALCAQGLQDAPGGGAWISAAPWARTRQLLHTTLGAELMARALQNPQACADAFNRGARTVPRAARPLVGMDTGGVELPLWHVDHAGMRRRVGSHMLPELQRMGATLVPRAFLTSAIARAALCDRFVHGTGGALYERATETFVGEWLGAELPAFDMATATVQLPFQADLDTPVVTPAHRRHVWFDPEREPGGVISARKRHLLDAVNAAPRRSIARRQAWKHMHHELGLARSMRSADMDELLHREAQDRLRSRATLIRVDRTWPVPLHPRWSLTQLAELIRQAH